MKADSFVGGLQQLFRNFPIRINLIVLVALSAIAFYNIQHIAVKDNSYAAIIRIVAKLGLIMLIFTVALSLISTIAAWWRLRFLAKTAPENFSISIREASTSQKLHFSIAGSFMPLLGYVDIRFTYNKVFSPLFRLHLPGRFFNTRLDGFTHLLLPDIKVYDIEYCRMYIKDMLQLIALPVTIDIKRTLYNVPVSQNIHEPETTPRKTEELEVKIKELRKSEGEWLHYKNFESNDDVRRIVWKIFAKNKELVVRNPEIFNPYASRIDVLSSFYCNYFFKSDTTKNALLNFYKNINWTIYNELGKGDFLIRLLTDQNKPVNSSAAKDRDPVAAQITVCDWQHETLLTDSVDSKNLAAIIIHSLNDYDDITATLEKLNKNTIVYFVPLSKGLKKNQAVGLLHRLFFTHSDSPGLSSWANWSDMKTIKNHELNLIHLLESSGHTFTSVL